MTVTADVVMAVPTAVRRGRAPVVAPMAVALRHDRTRRRNVVRARRAPRISNCSLGRNVVWTGRAPRVRDAALRTRGTRNIVRRGGARVTPGHLDRARRLLLHPWHVHVIARVRASPRTLRSVLVAGRMTVAVPPGEPGGVIVRMVNVAKIGAPASAVCTSASIVAASVSGTSTSVGRARAYTTSHWTRAPSPTAHATHTAHAFTCKDVLEEHSRRRRRRLDSWIAALVVHPHWRLLVELRRFSDCQSDKRLLLPMRIRAKGLVELAVVYPETVCLVRSCVAKFLR